ncbi:MAG: 5'/3'-nucleotidase SurE [Candidatus Aphodosoma sp.]
MERPLILVTNDDGIQAPGINVIAEAAARHADVVVVAPDGPRSAQSSALTIETPVSARRLPSTDGIVRYATSGTPADCVKLAMSQLLHRKPALLISGINHGSNASINVLYSGTIGAAIEGCQHSMASIGFSLCDHSHDADFSKALPFFEAMIVKALSSDVPMPHNVCLNVNAPAGEIKGVRVCRQAEGVWADEFVKDAAPRAKDYYWMIGDFKYTDSRNDKFADQMALDEGYISVVPVQVDMTAYHAMEYCRMYETEVG